MPKKHLFYFFSAVLLAVWFFPYNISAQDVPGGQPGTGRVPTGQAEEESGRIGAEVFGRDGGYVHPFLFMETKHTDNLYYTNTDEDSEVISSITPGLWLAVPANRQQLMNMNTSPTSSGGLQVSRMKPASVRRMQTYFMYAPSAVYYRDNSENDHIAHRAEAMFQYNFDMGLSVDLIDQFNNREEVNNNAEERLDEYYDNVANLLLTFEPSEKFRFRVDYSNYWLDYDDRANRFRNRMDNSVSAYAFYQMLPKTSAFVQYGYTDIAYDENSALDSQEHSYYLGLDWNVTADTRGRVKAGYMKKKFDDSQLGDEDGFSAELQMQHSFNPKRSASLTAFRRYTEPSVETAYSVMTTGMNFSLMQRFTPKWSATLSAAYNRDDYQGEETIGGRTAEREDDTYRAGPSLVFEPRDWMKVDLGYYFSKRDSNFDVYDFENNTVYLSLEFTL